MFNEYRGFYLNDDIVQKMDSGDVCSIYMYLLPLNCTFKNNYNGKFYVLCILPQLKKYSVPK